MPTGYDVRTVAETGDAGNVRLSVVLEYTEVLDRTDDSAHMRTEQSRSASGACFCCRGDRGAAVVAANFIGGVGHGRVEMCAPAAAYSRSLVALFGDADKRSARQRLTHVQVPCSIDTTSTAPKADMANTKPQLTAALFAERLETGPRCAVIRTFGRR